jgi:hypothetical protein
MTTITPEYVVEYITKNDKIIENLKNKIISLENEKAVVAERNKNILFRLTTAERQIYDLNNTLMNHFAYKNRTTFDPTFGTIIHHGPNPSPPQIQNPVPNPFNSLPVPSVPSGPSVNTNPFTFNPKI